MNIREAKRHRNPTPPKKKKKKKTDKRVPQHNYRIGTVMLRLH